MSELYALDLLPPGESAYVTDIRHEPSMLRRLTDLGLIEGTRITCLFRSPSKDPTAYLIRGAVIALRSIDAHSIQVMPIPLSDPQPVRATV